MADDAIKAIIGKYAAALPQCGITSEKIILYGSFARGDTHEWSDIDVVVVAPVFYSDRTIATAQKLWLATRYADNCIEPVSCGSKEWEAEFVRPIIDIARREGVVVWEMENAECRMQNEGREG